MHRRTFLGLLSGAALVMPSVARAQQRPRLVGAMFGGAADDPDSVERATAFRQGLSELGWADGRDIRLEFRWGAENPERARLVAAELAALGPDAFLSSGTVATTALRDIATQVPVVFVNVTDPVAGGFVASLPRPGRNFTGFSPFEYPIAGKWLEQLREIAPDLKHVALMGDPNNHNYRGFWQPFEAAATRFGIEPLQLPARSAAEIEGELASLGRTGGSGVIVTAALFSVVHRDLIVTNARRHRLPAIYWSRVFAANGGLIAYGPSIPELHRQSAQYIHRILKGETPGELPVQQADRYVTVVNLQAAKAIGLNPPPSLLLRADEVIE